MFILQTEPRWTWPVVVRAPAEAGAFTEHRFSGVWRLLPAEDRDELGKTESGTDDLLRRSIVELRDIQDEAGQPVQHSTALVDALIAIPWVRRGLIAAYAEALAGVPSEAARGN
jgi:hypothetical protein